MPKFFLANKVFGSLLQLAKYLHAQPVFLMLKRLAALKLLSLTMTAGAQTGPDTAAPYQAAVNNAIAVYQQFRGHESNLYIGLALEQSNVSAKGSAYYGTNDWFRGSVFYDGAKYDSVLLKYDLVRDELIALNPVTRNAFYLFKQRVDYFTLGNKTFINLRKGRGASLPSEGYYEQLAKGSLTLLEKHTKSYQESFSIAGVEQRFDEKAHFYALKGGVYHALSNAKSLYALTGNYKNQIKEQLKKQNLESGKNLELTLVTIAQYYNQANQ